jgi:hypothetical protein
VLLLLNLRDSDEGTASNAINIWQGIRFECLPHFVDLLQRPNGNIALRLNAGTTHAIALV